jgi:hypothetical protein
MRKVTYKTEKQRNKLIVEAAKKNEKLIEEARLIDGNYLIFDVLPTIEELIKENELHEEPIKDDIIQMTKGDIIEEIIQKVDEKLTDNIYNILSKINKEPVLSEKEKINAYVVQKIRERYSIDDELKMQRLGIQERNNLEYKRYLNHVNVCIEWGDAEKKKYGL